jgi:hypothetical protein
MERCNAVSLSTSVRSLRLLLETLGTIFRVDVSVALQDTYCLALSDLPLDVLHFACRLAILYERHSMPEPATLRKYAQLYGHPRLTEPDTSTLVQWKFSLLARHENCEVYRMQHWRMSVGCPLKKPSVVWREN